MNVRIANDEAIRHTLGVSLDADPPAGLRERVLGRYRRRRQVQRMTPVLAVAVMALAGWLSMPMATLQQKPAQDDWQLRSAQLEDALRVRGDSAWLRNDARARELLRQLRHVDHELNTLYSSEQLADAGRRDALWQQRSETLSALLHSREQGGMAVRL